jgi:hypothetical protein
MTSGLDRLNFRVLGQRDFAARALHFSMKGGRFTKPDLCLFQVVASTLIFTSSSKRERI